MTPIKPALFKTSEAAKYLAISEWEIRRLANEGILHRRYIGEGRRYYRITAESLDAYVESLSA